MFSFLSEKVDDFKEEFNYNKNNSTTMTEQQHRNIILYFGEQIMTMMYTYYIFQSLKLTRGLIYGNRQ